MISVNMADQFWGELLQLASAQTHFERKMDRWRGS